MPEISCAWCGNKKKVRQADLDRGWGKFCSKSCKAKHQEKRTGQYKELCDKHKDINGEELDHIFDITSCSEGLNS